MANQLAESAVGLKTRWFIEDGHAPHREEGEQNGIEQRRGGELEAGAASERSRSERRGLRSRY